MRLNLRGKLFAVSLAIIGFSILSAELSLRPAIEANLQDRIRTDLFARLALIELTARTQTDLDRAHWDALADQMGAAGRVTFIDANGDLLGDSQVPLAELAQVENHRQRPEVAAALAGSPGTATRSSGTVHQRLLYAAIPLSLPRGGRGVARLSVPLDGIDAAVRKVQHILAVALLVALVIAASISMAAAQILSRALGRMTDAARRMAAGDLDVRTRPTGRDEIASLGRALDVMAENLASTLTALRSERDLLGVILQSMQESVLVLDPQNRMLLVNPALRATFALGPDAEGRAALELIRNADLHAILDRARSGGGAATGEIEVTGPKPRRLLVHAAALPPIDRKPQGILAVFVDVSEIRRLETMRKDFVANVSHELRTPITAVRSAVDTLRLTLSDDPDASGRFVDIIDRNAQRLGSLVEDLLDLSRIESKEYRPEATPVSAR
ncbi:MAG TPA: histidine kinase dimerization/phospho-acceptor domain-containing protein, partial [Polyangia bacterium]|nr:histidine kinase dimerization/phospho-acceptor domain-containing protein [Polyangia bacterium]